VLSTLLILSLSCGPFACDETTEPDPIEVRIDAECDNVNPHYCMLPWPSSRYLTPDDSTETGWRVDYPPDAFPLNTRLDPFDTGPYNRFDGFPPSAQILTLFDAPVDGANLPSHLDYDASVAAGSPTVVLDMATGQRVAHFAEFDVNYDDPSKILLYIRPATRLLENRRYAVAIRDLQYADGGDVGASEVFAALRDGVVTTSALVEGRRDSFEELFTALDDAGVPREGLIQAWDFHTASGASIWGDMLAMRDDALERVGDDGLGCNVTMVTDDYDASTLRRIDGTVTVPLYLDSASTPSNMVRDEDGRPVYQGDVEVPFIAVIPNSLAGAEPGRIMTMGHGFFDSAEVVPAFSGYADDYGVVLAGTDWWGLCGDDALGAAIAVSNLSLFPEIPERLMQAYVNHMVLQRSLAGVCTEQEAFQIDGETAYDPEQNYFWGISLGAILGTSLMALSPEVDRGTLTVGAANFSMMQSRSAAFGDLELVYSAWYEDRVDREFYWSVIGQLFEMVDPVTYAPHLLDDPLPGSPANQVLYQVSRGDELVCNIASDMAVRTAGLELITPTPHDIWGVNEAAATPYDGSAVQYWDAGVPDPPVGNEPPDFDWGDAAHIAPIGAASAEAQMDEFLRPGGLVTNQCEGICDLD